jgi:hypothetical protein
MENRGTIIRQLTVLFMLALVLRVAYLLLALHNIGVDQFVGITFDSQTYLAASRELFGSVPDGPSPLFLVGPGYGLILGLLRMIFGESYLPGMIFSIVMGSLAPVAVYLFAWAIFRHARLALLAGLICAVSHTSLSMSGRILTDLTFFTLHCFVLVCLIEGLRSARWKWFIGAGLLCGVAALIRPAGQFWPYIFLFLPFVLPLPDAFTSRTRLLGRVAVVGLLALTMTLSWSARNYFVNGVFTFGNVGIQTVRNCVVAQIDGARLGKHITDMRVIYDGEDGDHILPLAESCNNMNRRVRTTIATYPGEFVSVCLRNVWANTIESNPYLARDFPILVDLGWSRIWEILKNTNRVLFLVSILAFVLLARDRQWSGFVILGVVFAYFTLVTGFSIWQGSRLHYPAEMAWAVLIAYLWLRLRNVWRKQPLQLEGARF